MCKEMGRRPRNTGLVARYAPKGRTAKEIESLVLEHGWRYSHASGGHRYYTREGDSILVCIPWHRRALKPKTEASILKQAGLR
jgi:predicted RNA binding protein YcfA (HicA-like mRNA interferase family)